MHDNERPCETKCSLVELHDFFLSFFFLGPNLTFDLVYSYAIRLFATILVHTPLLLHFRSSRRLAFVLYDLRVAAVVSSFFLLAVCLGNSAFDFAYYLLVITNSHSDIFIALEEQSLRLVHDTLISI
jgi:hypothetical protein